jgi:hypothetical protein
MKPREENSSMKKMILATVMVFFAASPAFANGCPREMAKIDDALKTATLSDSEKKRVQVLRDKGGDEHKAGKHADSMKTLAEAKAILKIQ